MNPRHWLAIVVVVIGGWVMVRRVRRTSGAPVSFSDLEFSQTALELGIDNTIPEALHARARGLAVVMGAILAVGEDVSSAYRSPLLDAAVHFKNENGQDVTPNLATLAPRHGNHTLCASLDARGAPGADAPSALLVLDRRLRGVPAFAECVTSTLVEGDHLHCDFDVARLEALGRAANPDGA